MDRFPPTLSECQQFRRDLWEHLEENPGLETREPSERITDEERKRNFVRTGDPAATGR